MNDELKKLLSKLEDCHKRYKEVSNEYSKVSKEYKSKLHEIDIEMEGYLHEIYKNQALQVTAEELIEELTKMHGNEKLKIKIDLNGFLIAFLKENEREKEAFEKIKSKYDQNRFYDMIISGKNIETKESIFSFNFPFNVNVNNVLCDGTKLIDNLDEIDISISSNHLFGEKTGIIILNKNILMKANLNFRYEDLCDNSDFDEENCYPNVKILRDAIFNVLNNRTFNNDIRR